jgi:hypothetical protein
VRRSLLDLGPSGRVPFVCLFLGLELAGIAWGQRAPDHVLGFQMFNESSRITIRLFREVERKRRRVLIPLPDGRWQAPDSSGKLRDYSWHDRVHYYPLTALGSSVPAKYGLAAQLFRLQAALDDVMEHVPADTRTKALVAVVEATRNGAAPQTHRLRAERR